MQIIIRIALLATTAAVVFLNPLYVGRTLYYALLALLLALALLFWVTTWRIGRKRAARYVKEPLLHHESGSYSSSLDEKRELGALVVTEEKILFLVRRGTPIETAWEIERGDVIHLSPFVTKRKKGLLIATEEEGRYCYTKKPERLITLLTVPHQA